MGDSVESRRHGDRSGKLRDHTLNLNLEVEKLTGKKGVIKNLEKDKENLFLTIQYIR